MYKHKHNGFTIVELLIVIIVIAILVVLSVVSYSNISSRANVTTLQSDLANNAKKLKLYNAQYGSYPTGLNSSGCPTSPTSTSDSIYCLKYSNGNTINAYSGSSSSFNLKIQNATKVYQITDSTSASDTGMSPAPPISNNWSVSSTDPIISWYTNGTSLQTFAVPANSMTDITQRWQYTNSTNWSNFGGSDTFVSATVYWNNTAYNGYVKSSDWSVGNTSYSQRVGSLGTIYTTNEVTARNNRVFTGY